MKVLLEVFRNTPAGKNCLALSSNVAQVVASNLDKDIEVRFLPLSSPEADERGVELAPALVVNRRRVVEGVPSPEEIAGLIESALPTNLGIILTKGPQGGEDAENALDVALKALEMDDRVGLFLLSDGVWAAKKGLPGAIAQKLEAFLRGGGQLTVSGEHLEAAGLGPERLVEGASIAPDPYDRLVDLVMEEWDKVIVF
jgi:sulfur relay (sulfurtransferase) DsrF/TusC family protein